ncbi:hypothetical protein BC828DRAFT_397764 [Blastocladiella britannica]|nr:hypothetical protein BC828DRAFT_397764 [Blastocladiella britannica]
MVHPTKTPGFVRRLLRSLSAFEFGSAPSALLLQVWFWSFTPQELALDDAGVLLASAIRRRQIDSFDSLREHCTNNNNNFPLVVTSDMVDAASRIGVPVLDRLWQLHCDQLHLPPIKFPSTATATAIDGARDVDTLDWWWQKHTQLGLPFKSVAAVHHAFTGRTARQVVQHIPTPIARSKLPTNIDDRPMQLAICQWWRDRATKNGLCSPSRQCTGTLVVDTLLFTASAQGRADTLDWIWRMSSSLRATGSGSIESLSFVAPDVIVITYATLKDALP